VSALREIRGAALVTGGASGLGAATARRLHAEGMAVLIADLQTDAATALAAELGEHAAAVTLDVTDAAAVAAAARHAAGMHDDGLRLTVACAGIGPAQRLLGRKGTHSAELFAQVVTVNLIGTFNLLRAGAEAMAANEPIDGERGLHVSTASAAAFEGQIGQVAYAASKAGVLGMTLPAARDLAQTGIRVCTLAPGTFDTPLMDVLSDEARAAIAASVPFPSRLGHPEEFADLVVTLARNGMVNGETIRIDGALRLAPR
jgi:NAD(P)-dependent dehydrogenase (short-subunit alcohol dehydrogenase family)